MLYVAAFSAIDVTAAQDVFEIVAPADAKIAIERIFLGQYTDFGEAEDELLPITGLRGYTTAGSGGGTLTPRAFNQGAAASAIATVGRNNTTVASNGTPLTLISETFNIRAGYLWKAPDPKAFETRDQYTDRRLIIEPGTRFVLRMGAPADSITMNGAIEFEELR